MSAVTSGRGRTRWIVGAVVVLHGLLHLLGAATGLGWSTVSSLSQPVGGVAGGIWLVVALLLVLAGLLLALAARWWWVVSSVAAVASQAVIATSWPDARVGTVVNVALLGAAVYGWASQGPRSLGREYHRRVSAALSAPPPAPPAGARPVVTEHDLLTPPASVAAYLRGAGALGRPRVTSLHAHLRGRIRASATSTWMPFTGEQVNTYGPESCRLFWMNANLHGIPVDVLHVLVGGAATMRVRVASLFPMVDAAGPEMDRAETVTFFNDLCVLAPAALVDADVTWTVLGPRRVHADFTRGLQTIGADLIFNEHDELVDFVSDDRLAGSNDGRTFTPRRWSTPLTDYRTIGGSRLATHGDARWGGPDPQSSFSYLELTIDDIAYNVASDITSDITSDSAEVTHPSSPRMPQHH
jgi:hypothetical protein